MGKAEGRRGTRIETRRRGQRRGPWLIVFMYAAVWAALSAVSTGYWFLPAGLRLATLWLLPRRHWWKLALAEWATVLALILARDAFRDPAALVLATLLPWCVYAAAVRVFARPTGPAPTPETMLRFLLCGLLAATANGWLLAAAQWLETGTLRTSLAGTVFEFGLGDFIGVLIVAPLLRLLHAQRRGAAVPWTEVLGHGLVLVPLLVALGLGMLPLPDGDLYPVMLAGFPLFVVAFRHGWRASAVAMALLSTGVYLLDDRLFRSWQPAQLQLLIAAMGFAALALGVSGDALRTQGRALKATIDMLSMRTRALADATKRIVSQQEDERRRIGSELHDQLGQDMTAIATRLRLAQRSTDDARVHEGLHAIEQLVADAHAHLREVIQSLHPLVLDRFGLARALADGPLRELASDHAIDYECNTTGPLEGLPTDVAAAVYRICQEVMTNAMRHGCGGHLRIRVAAMPDAQGTVVELEIEDEAGAFEIPTGNMGHGLQNIYDRADAIGGVYRFNPQSGHPRHAMTVRLLHGLPPED